jgi:hypothetical protein
MAILMKIKDIKVGKRGRKELRDIPKLASNQREFPTRCNHDPPVGLFAIRCRACQFPASSATAWRTFASSAASSCSIGTYVSLGAFVQFYF